MKNDRRWLRHAIFAVASLCVFPLSAQVPSRGVRPSIPSLAEPGESLAIRGLSPQNGFATFASAGGRGILLRVEATAPAETRAANFVDVYGRAFGLTHSSQLRLQRTEKDESGIEHVRMQQVHKGVPVRAAEFLVHLNGARVMAANGHIVADLPDSVTPVISSEHGRLVAQSVVEKYFPERATGAQYANPRLEILNRGILGDGSNTRSRLAWFVEATGPELRYFLWIDAESGVVLLHFSQFTSAKSRRIHNAQHLSTLPGPVVRTEGGAATGDADQDNAYTLSGTTYDYFLTNHGRDSYDGLGALMISSAHYCAPGYPQGSTCPSYQNAAWNGTQMIYADGFASADDVVGHELTHAVTEYSAGLLYYMQSGALNESYSDIFGETIDLLNGTGNDNANVRWRVGEDLPVGAIRDMMTPTAFGDPGKMSDSAQFYCNSSGWTDPLGDSGGVHLNSGIPNHAFALMVDGGTYNNTAITGIGLTKAAKIQYRALTVYLTSGSGFSDNANALTQSCTDLIGTLGITAGDCAEVTKALQAVEMSNTWPCFGATKAPPLCSTGTASVTFFDNFETANATWTATNAYGGWSSHSTGLSKSASFMAYGNDPNDVSDHRLALTSGVTIPAGGRLYFDHAFEFEFDYDGAVLEYSVTNGASWLDAASLIDAGQAYNGTIDTFGNPLGGRAGFVHSSYGYTGTRLNLASLAGQSVKFRFRIGSDISVGSLGWAVDNFTIYACTSVATGIMPVSDSAGNLGTVNVATEASTVTGNSGVFLTDIARASSGAIWGISFDHLYSLNPATGARTLIGPLGVTGMNALVSHGNGLLGASIDTTSLYSINPANGAATALIGSLGYPSMGDLAFHNGSLYAAVKNGLFSDLVRVSLSGNSFTATNLGHVTSDNELFGLARGTDGNLYGFSGERVWRINTANPPGSQLVVANYSGALSAATGASSPQPSPFTDDPLSPASTIAKTIHVNELRARIAAIRLARGLGVYTYTDPVLVVGASLIRGVHIHELRAALADAYTAAGSAVPSYTDPVVSGLRVKATHIFELRAAVTAME